MQYLLSAQSVVLGQGESASSRMLEMQNHSFPDLLSYNLNFNNIPEWFVCPRKFEKHCPICQLSYKMEHFLSPKTTGKEVKMGQQILIQASQSNATT